MDSSTRKIELTDHSDCVLALDGGGFTSLKLLAGDDLVCAGDTDDSTLYGARQAIVSLTSHYSLRTTDYVLLTTPAYTTHATTTTITSRPPSTPCNYHYHLYHLWLLPPIHRHFY